MSEADSAALSGEVPSGVAGALSNRRKRINLPAALPGRGDLREIARMPGAAYD
jgi:hypothetical protein